FRNSAGYARAASLIATLPKDGKGHGASVENGDLDGRGHPFGFDEDVEVLLLVPGVFGMQFEIEAHSLIAAFAGGEADAERSAEVGHRAGGKRGNVRFRPEHFDGRVSGCEFHMNAGLR